MANATMDGGGSDGFPHTKYYDEGIIHGGGEGTTSGGPGAPSALSSGLRTVLDSISPVSLGAHLLGMGDTAYDKVKNAVSGTNPGAIKHKGSAYSSAGTAATAHGAKVSKAIGHLSSWSGDDADQARKILQGLQATYYSLGNNATNMGNALTNMGTNLQSVKDNFSHDQGAVGNLTNMATGSDDRAAADAYKNLMSNFSDNVEHVVPEKVPTEVKQGAPGTTFSTPATPGAGAPGGAPSASGPGSAQHMGGITPPKIKQPTFDDPTQDPPPRQDPPKEPVIDPPKIPTSDYPDNPYDPNGNGIGGVSPYQGGGAGSLDGYGGGADTSGSLAGFDPSGAGGGGAGLGAGGGTGAGLGGGVPGGAGGGVGTGVPAGAGGGAGIVGGGAGAGNGAGAGGRGMMMPMQGGGQGNDEERERTTWLSEDDDIWGADEALPGVIK